MKTIQCKKKKKIKERFDSSKGLVRHWNNTENEKKDKWALPVDSDWEQWILFTILIFWLIIL